MQQVIFESRLMTDGHLYCPKEYAISTARFKVIAYLADESASDKDIEMAAVTDQSGEFLSAEEMNYYMSLGEEDGVLQKYKEIFFIH